ncbi:hypothetical protein OROGR_025498 [Orobanche gracilis]
MKLIFLGSSLSIVWYIRRHKIVRRSYDKDQDTFRHYFLIIPCFLLALIINEKFTFRESYVGFFLVLGSCCHPSSVGLAAKNKKYRQPDRAVYFSSRCIPIIVHFELDLSLFHATTLCPLDKYINCLPLQHGFRGLFRHCFMLISSIITSKAGRII